MLVYVFYRNNPEGFNLNGLTIWLKMVNNYRSQRSWNTLFRLQFLILIHWNGFLFTV